MLNSSYPSHITPSLIEAIRTRYALEWHGIHGVSHWARVRNNGLKLADLTGANRQVVELFAFLHDSCRLNDGYDREHGRRAARFAESLLDTHICEPKPCIPRRPGYLNKLPAAELAWRTSHWPKLPLKI